MMKNKKKLMLCIISLFLIGSVVGCGSKGSSPQENEEVTNVVDTTQTFPKFQGKDFDGNPINESIFKENKVTVLSFWFNGCSACVDEMPTLEKFNQKLKELNAEIIGVNIEAVNGEKELQEAKDILSKQGCTYRNIAISGGKEAEEFLSKITAFPTTILVDQNGLIIDSPITGNIESEEAQSKILETIKKTASGEIPEQEETINPEDAQIEDISPSDSSTQENMDLELMALYEETEKIFDTHNDLWQKIFANANKEDGLNQDLSYAEYLTKTLEKTKDLTSEEREQAVNDIKRIDELDQQIQALEGKSNN